MEKWLHGAIALATVVGCTAVAAVVALLLALLGVPAWPLSGLVGGLCFVALSGMALHMLRRHYSHFELTYSSPEVAEVARVFPALLSASRMLHKAEEGTQLAGKAVTVPMTLLAPAQAIELLADVCANLDKEDRIELENALQNEGWGVSYPVMPEGGSTTCRFYPPGGQAFVVRCTWFRGEEWEEHVDSVRAHFPYRQMELSSKLLELTSSCFSQIDNSESQRKASHDQNRPTSH